MAWEYKVVPAPAKGVKEKGVKTPEARFAHGLEQLLNDLAWDGWQFQRAETLPSDERSGLTGSQTVWRHVLIFCREVEEEQNEMPAEPPVALIEDMGETPEEPEVEAPQEATEQPEAQDTGENVEETDSDDIPDSPETLGDRARMSLGWRPAGTTKD